MSPATARPITMFTVAMALLAALGIGPVTAKMAFPNPLPTRLPIIQPPLVIWHGMGDTFDSSGIEAVVKQAEMTNPGTYVHVIRLDDEGQDGRDTDGTHGLFNSWAGGKKASRQFNKNVQVFPDRVVALDGGQDQKATLYGNVTDQIQIVCHQLQADPVLSRMSKINGLGFSQGGLFLRALIQECDWFAARIHSLVAMGSPNNGIADVQICRPYDLLCRGAIGLLKGNAWSNWTQAHIVPAQYYRPVQEPEADKGTDRPQEPVPSEDYLKHSALLAKVNNERVGCYGQARTRCGTDPVAASRLGRSLRNLGLFAFSGDTVLLPPVTAWFAATSQSAVGSPFFPDDTVPLHRRQFWTEDWIGLRAWAERVSDRAKVPIRGRWTDAVPELIGGPGEPILKDGESTKGLIPQLLPPLVFGVIDGQHMHISKEALQPILAKFFGPLSTVPLGRGYPPPVKQNLEL